MNNGQPNSKAGWAFWHGSTGDQPLVVSGRLELKGPFGHSSQQTSDRAELRAVLAALRYRDWLVEDFHTVVIATDSEYVVCGSTEWVKKWMEKGWVHDGNRPVKDRDLWEAILGEVERLQCLGKTVKFWKIPRKWNRVADAASRAAAKTKPCPNSWEDVGGMFDPESSLV